MLPVLGAIAGSLSYSVIEIAQEDVFSRALPTALAAQEINALALGLVAATGATERAASPDEAEALIGEARRDLVSIEGLLREIDETQGKTAIVSGLVQSVEILKSALEQRFGLVTRRQRLRDAFDLQYRGSMDSISDILTALRPESIALSARFVDHGAELRAEFERAGRRSQSDDEIVLKLEELLERDIYAVQRIGDMLFRAEALRDNLDRLALTEDESSLAGLKAEFELTFRNLLRASFEMEPGDAKEAVSASLVALAALTIEQGNIFETMDSRIAINRSILDSFEESNRQSGIITKLTEEFVAESKLSIVEAETLAREAIDFSRVLLVAIAVVAFTASLAAIWFFVNRNVIQRLAKLTEATSRLAQGDLETRVDDPIADELGEMAQAIVVFRDNAIKLRESEEELRFQQEEQRLIFDNVPARIWFKDDRNRILRLNRQAANSMGLDVSEAEGADTYDLFPSIAAKYHEDDLAVIRSGEPMLGIVEEYIPAEGDRGWVRTDKVPYTDPKTGEHYILVASSDITREKQAEEALEQSIEELRQSNKQLQQFAYIASHDLQEPLRMVASYCDLLERRFADKLGDDGREFIAFASDGAKRMQNLINDLLKYSRAGNEEYTIKPFELGAVMDAVLRDLQILIEERRAVVEVGPLPAVKGDKDQIRRVLQNLVHNAIKFNENDSPKVIVTAEPTGSYWEISVSDDGIGIDEKFSERIFDVFQRLNTRDEYAGTGIGLAIVRRIVERHGGTVTVAGKPSAGTVFKFTLPDVQTAVLPRTKSA